LEVDVEAASAESAEFIVAIGYPLGCS
jgi:hypothetical protein